MKKLDIESIPMESGCNYPPPFDKPCLGSTWRRLGRAGGLKAFGVNLSRIPPGVWSSQRHWHSHEDEFVMMLEGELTLVSNDGEEKIGPGECVAFRAGNPDGHHLINRSSCDAVVLEIGNCDQEHDRCVYSDIDMVAEPGIELYLHRDGAPYPLNKT